MDEFNNFRSDISQHRIDPDPKAWNRVEEKLELKSKNKKRRYILFRRYMMGIAAVALIALFARVAIVNDHDQVLSRGQVASWESLDVTGSNIYDINKVRDLKNAYPMQ